MSVRRSCGAVSRGLFKYSSTTGPREARRGNAREQQVESPTERHVGTAVLHREHRHGLGVKHRHLEGRRVRHIGLEFEFPVLPFSPKARWRQPVDRLEGAGERRHARVTRGRRNSGHRRGGTRELAGRAVQPQALDRVGQRLAVHRVVHAVPVMRRQAGQVGQHVQGERLVEVVVHVGDDALHARLVARPLEAPGAVERFLNRTLVVVLTIRSAGVDALAHLGASDGRCPVGGSANDDSIWFDKSCGVSRPAGSPAIVPGPFHPARPPECPPLCR